METNRDYSYQNVIQLDDAQTSSRKFMANVFAWMFVALGVSAGLAYVFAANLDMQRYIIDPVTHGFTGLGILAVFSPLLFILLIRFGLNRISYPILAGLFLLYAAVTGISLSGILLMYTAGSIYTVFAISAGVFAIMAVAGYTTHQDLTTFGSLLIMALVGIIIASVVNMFLHSSGLYYIISYLGVAIFVGLTAYDVQKLKQIGANQENIGIPASKLALIGALTLYLDFVNLFLYLLRIFGRRR